MAPRAVPVAMIAVKVRTIGPLKELFGTGELEVSLPAGADVDDLLASLTEAFGERCSPYFAPRKDAAALPHLRIMVNGRDIAVLGDRQATLGNDDEILMLTPVAGG